MRSLKKNKNILIISIISIVIIILGSVILIHFHASSATIDTSKLLETQTIDNLEFSNASMDGNKLKVIVHNMNDQIYSLKTIDVIFRDSSGNDIQTVNTYIGNSIESGEYKQLVIDTDADLSNAYSIQYRINK